jgi:hypothetical protein
LDTLHEWVKDRVETVQKTETLLGKNKKSERVVLYGEEVVIDDSEEQPDLDGPIWSDDEDVCFTLEGNYKGKKVEFNLHRNKTYSVSKNSRPQEKKAFIKPSNPSNCPVCLDNFHDLFACGKFKKLTARQRFAIVRNTKSCYHCLKRESFVELTVVKDTSTHFFMLTNPLEMSQSETGVMSFMVT